jgi:hypothetical protein
MHVPIPLIEPTESEGGRHCGPFDSATRGLSVPTPVISPFTSLILHVKSVFFLSDSPFWLL